MMPGPHAQVGWLSGPADMIKAVAKAHQFLVFTVPSALQVGGSRWAALLPSARLHHAVDPPGSPLRCHALC